MFLTKFSQELRILEGCSFGDFHVPVQKPPIAPSRHRLTVAIQASRPGRSPSPIPVPWPSSCLYCDLFHLFKQYQELHAPSYPRRKSHRVHRQCDSVCAHIGGLLFRDAEPDWVGRQDAWKRHGVKHIMTSSWVFCAFRAAALAPSSSSFCGV